MNLFNPSKITSKYRANLILETYKTLLKKGNNILDLGCGTGVVTGYLKDSLKIKITGCDIKNYLIQPIPFILIKESGQLPLKNKSYDAVMLNDVLHHIEEQDQYRLLAEALRIGEKVLIFEAKPTLSGKIFDIVLNKIHYGDLKAPLTFKSESEWVKIFKKLNAKHKTIQVNSFLFYPFSHIAFILTKQGGLNNSLF